jgi:RNA recognition motif-containing protein
MTATDAQKAMSALNGREIDGKSIKVNEAKPQAVRAGANR